jgi:TetR/AcrR family transcriptional regulator, cholesterol catabolism regulator
MNDSKSTSRRGRNKQEKLERIKQAARDLFASQGYEATTIRHISDSADVAVGTVFIYFKDKGDLLVKLFEEDLEATWQQVSKTEPRGTLIENLLTVFTRLLEFYNKDQKLSILFLKEVLSKDASQGWSEQVERFLEHITNLVEQAQETGETQRGNATQAARNFFALYYAALTAMLSSSLTVEVTVQHFLKPALELQLNGLLEKGGRL